MTLPAAAFAATPVTTDRIAGHEVWTAAASPYLVEQDLTVSSDAELVLEPGVEVRFANQDGAGVGLDPKRVELVVLGALRANGTSASPIALRAAESDFANSWSGVRIAPSSTRASFSYVTIEAAKTALESAAPGQVLSVEHCTLRKSFDGLHLVAGAPQLFGLELESNSVSGLHLESITARADLRLENSVVRLNGSYGILLEVGHAQDLNASITSSTIYGNTSAGISVQAQGATNTVVKVTGSIVASNGILGVESRALDGASVDTQVTYSNVVDNGMSFAGVTAGEGCISAPPAFVDAPWDLRLAAGSPCIDSADPTSAPSTDIDGTARPVGPRSDMGAYESTATAEGGQAGATNEAGATSEAGAANAGGAANAAGGAEQRAGASGVHTSNVGASSSSSGCSCGFGAQAPNATWLLVLGLAAGRAQRRRRHRSW
jgi:MYXO-CTERM domain-containing protein